jgi:uncharacterized protein YlxW (UPF0749 family)
MVENQVREVTRLEAEGERLVAEVDQMAGEGAPPAPDPATWLDVASGRAAVEGPGVAVVLDDAPAPPDRGAHAPDSYVVHQEDIEAVLNTLWGAGAEAIAVQGQRLTSVSVIRCVGNVLLLDGRTYSPPYAIDAIGDSGRLISALETSPLTEAYRSWSQEVGLEWSVRSRSSVRIGSRPGGSITLRYIIDSQGGEEEGAS